VEGSAVHHPYSANPKEDEGVPHPSRGVLSCEGWDSTNLDRRFAANLYFVIPTEVEGSAVHHSYPANPKEDEGVPHPSRGAVRREGWDSTNLDRRFAANLHFVIPTEVEGSAVLYEGRSRFCRYGVTRLSGTL
jgi:hypothetical protein